MYAGATLLGDGRVALILDVAVAGPPGRSWPPAWNAHEGDATPWPRRRRQRRTGCSSPASGTGGSRSRWTWSPGWRSSRSSGSSGPAAARWCSTATRSCPCCGCRTCSARTRPRPGPTVPVVVYTENGRVRGPRRGEDPRHRRGRLNESRRDFGDDGLLGSAVIQQRVTELLDVRRAILAADPMFSQGSDAYDPYDPYAPHPSTSPGSSGPSSHRRHDERRRVR